MSAKQHNSVKVQTPGQSMLNLMYLGMLSERITHETVKDIVVVVGTLKTGYPAYKL
jgi:hypothetical protein